MCTLLLSCAGGTLPLLIDMSTALKWPLGTAAAAASLEPPPPEPPHDEGQEVSEVEAAGRLATLEGRDSLISSSRTSNAMRPWHQQTAASSAVHCQQLQEQIQHCPGVASNNRSNNSSHDHLAGGGFTSLQHLRSTTSPGKAAESHLVAPAAITEPLISPAEAPLFPPATSCSSSQQQYMEALGTCSQYAMRFAAAMPQQGGETEGLQHVGPGGSALLGMLLEVISRHEVFAYAALGYHVILAVLLVLQQQKIRRCKHAMHHHQEQQKAACGQMKHIQAPAAAAAAPGAAAGARGPSLVTSRAQLITERPAGAAAAAAGNGFDDDDLGAPFAAYGRGSGLRGAHPGAAAAAANGGSGSLVARPAAALYAAAKAAAASGRRLASGAGGGGAMGQGTGQRGWDDDLDAMGYDQDKNGDRGQWTRDYGGRLIRAGMKAASGAAVRAGSGMGAAAGTAVKRAKGGAASAMMAAMASMSGGRAAVQQGEAKQEVVSAVS